MWLMLLYSATKSTSSSSVERCPFSPGHSALHNPAPSILLSYPCYRNPITQPPQYLGIARGCFNECLKFSFCISSISVLCVCSMQCMCILCYCIGWKDSIGSSRRPCSGWHLWSSTTKRWQQCSTTYVVSQLVLTTAHPHSVDLT